MFRSTFYRLCTSTFSVTLRGSSPAVQIHNKVILRSSTAGACTVFSNESFAASDPFHARAVWLELNKGVGWFGLLPATATGPCADHRLGTRGLPGSVACRIGHDTAAIVCNDKELLSIAHDCTPPLLLDVTVTDGVAAFRVDGKSLPCPALNELKLTGDLRVGFSTGAVGQLGALALDSGRPKGTALSERPDATRTEVASDLKKVVEDIAKLMPSTEEVETGAKDDDDDDDDDAPEVGPLYTDPTARKLEANKEGPIVALTPTVLRCNTPQDGTVYVPVPIGTAEDAAIGISVRFTGISKGYVGCGFFKKEALDAGEACEYLLGKTQHSIGCLLKGGEVFVFIDDKPVFCGDTPKNDELTMHFSFDRKKGMLVRIEKGVVNCDEFKDMSLFAGDLYFGISMSEEGQLARILPSGLGAPRFHYGMNSMDVNEDKLMTCKHSIRASLSGNERWYGNADKCFAMRITNVCREPIGIGLVSAKLWNNGRKNMVGGKEFGPHSIGLILKDRRIYVHFQDEFVQWKPIGRMPPFPKTVDLMMRVSGGKVSFFYQGIPIIMPVISDLTLPADERFRAAYTMSDKGQTAVIPPNLPVSAPDNVKQRCSLLGDTAHVELAEDSRVAKALFAGALCFSSEAFAITPCAWNAYPQGCSGCQCNQPSAAVCSRGTLWLCALCNSPEEYALCDACYWNLGGCWHAHPRNTFIPLFGAGFNEMRLTVEDAKDSYLEVGVAPASYEDSLGVFGKHMTTTVLLGKVSDLVTAAVPAEKIVAACPALKNGDEVWIRVVGAEMSVLVNRSIVFKTTLSAEDDPFLKQPLRYGVRMSATGQTIRAHHVALFSPREGETISVPADAAWMARECDAARVPTAERAAAGTTGKLVAMSALDQIVTVDVDGELKKCPLPCALEGVTPRKGRLDMMAEATQSQSP